MTKKAPGRVKQPCPYDKAANTVDCGNPYQHWEKERLIDAILFLHKRIDAMERRITEARTVAITVAELLED